MKYGLAFLFWSVVAFFFATQAYILGPDRTWAAAFAWAAPRWYIWGALTPLVIGVDRRLPGRERLPRRLLMHAGLGILWTAVFAAINMVVQWGLSGTLAPIDQLFFARNFHWNYLIYWLIVGVYLAWDSYAEMQRRELQSAHLEKLLAEARLHTLQSQLHPHFLFNTLNAISAYMEKEPRVARRMMAELGELLRFSLDHASRQEITLAEELAFLENYLNIERMRFEDQLTIEVQAEPEALEALVPGFLLQPLVENAIRHGITTRASAGHIAVTATRSNGQLALEVRDDGVGLPEGWQLTEHSGVGLSNTVARLEQLYPDRYAFRVDNAPDGGVRVAMTLPFKGQSPIP